MMTVPQFAAKKRSGEKIAMATAYDFALAKVADAAGVDAILVGDSLGMVVQGNANTLSVTLDQMIYHAEIVGRAVENALVVVDLPFPTFHLGVSKAVEAAARVLQEARCQAVKLEGGTAQAEVIAGLVSAGIPVMAHCGLRPQTIHQLGSYKVQRDEDRLMADSRAAQDAGAFSVVLECIPAQLAAKITTSLDIPTIGIGAGADCDGQVLVTHDLLGLTTGYVPRHVRQYANLQEIIETALTEYCKDVRDGTFPSEEQTFK